MRPVAPLVIAFSLILTVVTSAHAAIEVGDSVAVVTQTTIRGEGGATQTLPPGAVVQVEQVEATRYWVSAAVAGWIDSSATMELDAAAKHFADLAAKSPKDPVPLRALANVLRAAGKLEASLDNFCRTERLAPDDALTHRWRSRLILAADCPDEATGDACAAVRLAPSDVSALLDRANLYYCLDRYVDALTDYDAAIKLQPQSAAARTGRGDVKTARGDLAGAIADYTEAINLDPYDARPLVGRADCYARQQKEDLALDDLQAAIKVNPKSARALHQLARLELTAVNDKIRDPAKAIEHARAACELSNWRWMEPAMTLAEAHAAAGDSSRAVEMRVTALRIGMAETSNIANWRLRSHFERCRLEKDHNPAATDDADDDFPRRAVSP